MPARAPRTPSYRLHSPTKQAVVTLNGRDFYLGTHGSPESRAEYDRLIAHWLANGRHIAVNGLGGSDLTVNELVLAYLRHVDGYYLKDGQPTSEVKDIRLALKPLRKLYGHSLAREFGPLALKAVRSKFIELGLCRPEVNKRVGRVVRAFKWGAGEELLPPSVHHGLKAVEGLRRGRTTAREPEPVRPVADAFVDAVRPHVPRQVWAMIELQRLTGMRPGEVVIMRSGDLDTSGRIWVYIPERHKTEHHGRERRIYIGPQAHAVLRPWLRPDLAEHIFSPREALAERAQRLRSERKTKVQPSQRNRRKKNPKRGPGEHYTVRSYYYAIQSACERASVPRWHPHQLRHNAATRLRKEFGLDTARAVLGHSSPAVTAIYAEVDGIKAANAMAEVG